MKVIHITKVLAGGAGIAARRTVEALRAAGVDVELWSEGAKPIGGPKTGSFMRWTIDRSDAIPTHLYGRRRRFSSWSNNWRPTRLGYLLNTRADIVHLHWIGQGFLALDALASLKKPVVWTMHDAWPFTGGCHYPDGCDRYKIGCGLCPQLVSKSLHDLSFRNFSAKQSACARIASWIAPSAWLAELARNSAMLKGFSVKVIPNALDHRHWYPRSRSAAREELCIDKDSVVFVAGAADLREPRKGSHFLRPVVNRLATLLRRRIILLLFGKGSLRGPRHNLVVERSLGHLRDIETVARVFSCADLMLMPSLQDNLPNVVMEAQACGCPVVGFQSGGIGEIVQEGRTGLLTSNMTAEGLADAALQWLSSAPPRERVIADCIRWHREHYSPSQHAAALQAVYEEVLRTSRS